MEKILLRKQWKILSNQLLCPCRFKLYFQKYNKSIKRDEEHDDDDDDDDMQEQDDTLQAADTSFESATSNDGHDESNNRYLQMLSQDQYVDKIYGVREENGQFMNGNSPIEFEGSYIDVNGVKNAKTDGLLDYSLRRSPVKARSLIVIWRTTGIYDIKDVTLRHKSSKKCVTL